MWWCSMNLEEYINTMIEMHADHNDNMHDYFKWFLRNSRIYNTINREESKILSKNAIIKECYNNCFKSLHDTYKIKSKVLKYIEGYTMSLIPIEHAFLINENNEIIDPTLAINTKYDKRSERYGSEYIGITIPNDLLLQFRSNTTKYNQYLPIPFLYYQEIEGKDL